MLLLVSNEIIKTWGSSEKRDRVVATLCTLPPSVLKVF